MPCHRRQFLVALGAGLLFAGTPVRAGGPRQRAVVVGGGWGGLAAARHLRQLAPDLEVVLVERQAEFRSLPLSNQFLAGRIDAGFLRHDYARAAEAYGYRYLRAEVQGLDRQRRQLATSAGAIDYDWLVIAAGIRQSYGAWFGDDRQAIAAARRDCGSAWEAGDDLAALRQRLDGFSGGDLLMALPPAPYRCPPAPYERAVLIASRLKARRIPGRLLLLAPDPVPPLFRRILTERYRDQVTLVADTRVQRVDPFRKTVTTEFDEFRYDQAILMPPQQAADLLWQADLISRDSSGQPTGWADQDPLHLHVRDDPMVFIVGDACGAVSPLFGHYPKGGHLASRQGRIVAAEIAARAAGVEPPRLLPESLCFVHGDFEPAELVRLETRYRLRGDGLIEQIPRQASDPNPRGEDLQWARERFAELLAAAPS
jgi:NADPH-dependent 2,4-dienoyl-CoA reductase/sulfur reductase-like enzyme